MKTLLIGIRLALGTLFLLAGATPAGAVQPAPAAAIPAMPGINGDLLAFQLVTPVAGWAVLGNRLYWTDNSGATWRESTPPALETSTLRAASFADPAHGWVVATAASTTGDLSYSLARTGDGGQTWQTLPIDLFAPGDAAGFAGDVYLQFIDAQTGWLVVKQATSSNFNVGTLFGTQDGGAHWTRLSLPSAGPVHFTNTLDGGLDASATGNGRYVTRDGGQTWTAPSGPSAPNATGPGGQPLSAVSMATAQAGWAKSAAGQCTASACALVTQLLSTVDGGQTWTPVSLPDGVTSVQRAFPAAPAAAPGASAGGLRVTYDGQGWDACTIGTLPKLADMQTWYTSSPYGVWNLYMGGSSRANCGTLTRAYVRQLAQQGWLFIPTWVGPQAPCANVGHTHISYDQTTAYNEGVTEAFLARNVATSLGLTLADQSGTVIYYDVEYYADNSSDHACRQAVQAFISGWTGTLHGSGNQSGVYGAPCGPSLSDYAQVANVPDMVWIAWWILPYQYRQDASVLGFNHCDFNDGLWTNHQRLRQYAGDHDESWGGVAYNIDSDRIYGPVATSTNGCAPAAGQVALFVYPNYGGQCAVKGLGGYPISTTLGLPVQSISSLRVSPGVTVTLCQGEQYAPPCAVFGADLADLAGTAVGNNQAASALVSTGTLPLTNHVYLPFFPVNTSASLSLPLANGDFESGPTQWAGSSAQGRDLIVPSSALATAQVAPHSGQWAAWLGGVFTETASLAQTVRVPPGAPYLSFWQWIDSDEAGCYYDVATVWIDGAVVDSYGLCQSANTHGWARRVLNLSASAGRSVALTLQVQTDSSVNSSLFVDDFTFQSAP